MRKNAVSTLVAVLFLLPAAAAHADIAEFGQDAGRAGAAGGVPGSYGHVLFPQYRGAAYFPEGVQVGVAYTYHRAADGSGYMRSAPLYGRGWNGYVVGDYTGVTAGSRPGASALPAPGVGGLPPLVVAPGGTGDVYDRFAAVFPSGSSGGGGAASRAGDPSSMRDFFGDSGIHDGTEFPPPDPLADGPFPDGDNPALPPEAALPGDTPVPTPEPGTLALLGAGLAGLFMMRRRQK